VQAVQAPPSSRHSKPAPGSLALKAKLALVLALGSAGAESIVVAGTVRSMVTSITATPVLVAASVATARSARFPSASSGQEASYGAVASVPSETQDPVEKAALASEQRNSSTLVTSPSGVVAVTGYGSASAAFTKPAGWEIETVGAPASTTQV
jgi:hypothetical protein